MSNYRQSFDYDPIGNLTHKTSRSFLGAGDLVYDNQYRYYEDHPHRVEVVGEMWYLYDGNGNMVEERKGGHSPEGTAEASQLKEESGLYSLDYGVGLERTRVSGDEVYTRSFQWDEDNRLKVSRDSSHTVNYRYDADGQRKVKSSGLGETWYFDSMWTESATSASGMEIRYTKGVFLGEERIVTRLNDQKVETSYEKVNTYYYHPDHLGSVNMVTDYQGNSYEHLEYTPYGELWVENRYSNDSSIVKPNSYRFTGKEWDEETGFYYFEARYLNPKMGMFLSADPAMDGQNWYGYARNNPLRYTDPTGLMGDVEVPEQTIMSPAQQALEDFKGKVMEQIRPRTSAEQAAFDEAVPMGAGLSTEEYNKARKANSNAQNQEGQIRIEIMDLVEALGSALAAMEKEDAKGALLLLANAMNAGMGALVGDAHGMVDLLSEAGYQYERHSSDMDNFIGKMQQINERLIDFSAARANFDSTRRLFYGEYKRQRAYGLSKLPQP